MKFAETQRGVSLHDKHMNSSIFVQRLDMLSLTIAMHWGVRHSSRAVVWAGRLVLGASLMGPAPAAASPAEARRLNAAADAEFESASSAIGSDDVRAVEMIRRAASLYWQAAQALPEVKAHRQMRGNLVGKAISSYREAFRLQPSRETIEEPLSIVESYILTLEQVYGDRASNLPEHRRASTIREELRDEFEAILREETARAEELVRAQEEEQAAKERSAKADIASRHHSRQLKIGLGVSAGLAAVAGVAGLATGLSVVRDPFEGAAYRNIKEAVNASSLQIDAGTDYCRSAREQGVQQVVDACATHAATRRASTALLVTAGVAMVSTIVFAAILSRARRSKSARATAGHRGATIGFEF